MPHDAPGGPPSSEDILDTVEAIARVLGNGALYLRMLRRFCADHPAGASPVRDALASSDLNLAHRLAHTLKGTAGMIGAHRLHASASELEGQLRNTGAHGAMAQLLQLEQDLSDVLVVAARLLDGQPATPREPTGSAPPPAAAPTISAPGADLLLKQLALLLDTGDGAAIDLLEQAGPTLKMALGSTGFSEVMLAANAFDFEAALAALRRAAPQLEAPPPP